MNRAIVLIGVAKTGELPRLNGVERAVDAMEAWARKQEIPENRIFRHTDKDGSVTATQILETIEKLTDAGTVEQLIVYFSGHGVVNNRQEFWLLSRAPMDSNAAVNLEGSVALARGGAFPHVVLISDACRTQAPNLLTARINGSDIFPNIKDANVERSVDIFFATSLGAPALEVRVATEQGPEYHTVYSDAIVDALSGRVQQVVDKGYVRPHPLKRHLPALVRDQLLARKLSVLVTQTPDARITSDPDAWVAKVDAPDAAAQRQRGLGPLPLPPPHRAPAALPDREAVAKRLVGDAIRGFPSQERSRSTSPPGDVGLMSQDARELMAEAGVRQRSLAGLRAPADASVVIRGRSLKSAFVRNSSVGNASDEAVFLPPGLSRPAEVLVELDDGTSVLLPVLRNYATVVSFDGDALSDVSFVRPGPQGGEASRDLQELRSVIAAATARGLFSLEGDDALQLATRMQQSKAQDPALAVYAAYAYHELGQRDRIQQMQRFVREQFGAGLFDLALLGRDLLREETMGAHVVPSAPLLAQGWAFVAALGGPQAERLGALRPHLTSSIWSHYTAEGTNLLKASLRYEVDADSTDSQQEPSP